MVTRDILKDREMRLQIFLSMEAKKNPQRFGTKWLEEYFMNSHADIIMEGEMARF